MRSVLVSVKYRYCWVDRGRELDNGFVSEWLDVGEVSVISETALAGLFLEVIVRHMPGLVGSRRGVSEPSRNGTSPLRGARILPKASGFFLSDARGNPFLNHDESASIR